MWAQVFGVTRDPFIIWTSNMFAIASLRALYGLVANVLAELRFLEKAIAIVLAWIGAKMIIEVRTSRRLCCMAAAAQAQTGYRPQVLLRVWYAAGVVSVVFNVLSSLCSVSAASSKFPQPMSSRLSVQLD